VDGSNEIKNRHNYFFLGRNMDETPEGENWVTPDGHRSLSQVTHTETIN
jgi:hypothetical protein